jgi:phospholipase C
LADVTNGEALIKATYEAIRNSAAWGSSLLIITWDEHGGFYDHGSAPKTQAPGDTEPGDKYNNNSFTFQQYGPRVPAIVISPLIPKNLVDHRLYDHSCIPKLLESLFDMGPLTARDADAVLLDTLITLRSARQDAPETLPNPAASATLLPSFTRPAPDIAAESVTRPGDTVNEGNLPAIIHSAMRQDLTVSQLNERAAIVARVASLKSRADAMHYMADVQKKLAAHRIAAPRP